MGLLGEQPLRAAMTNFDSTRSLASSDTNAVDDNSQPYGSRLLPQVVDQLSQSDPKRVYATFPPASDLSRGFRDVTMLEIAQAVNKLAWWIEMNLGRSTVFETVAYIGPSDLRYAIVFLAAVKCGYKLLLLSVRNSSWINISLLEQTECTKFLYPGEISQKVQDLQEEKSGLQMSLVESLYKMLLGNAKYYQYECNYTDVRWDPVLVLLSSGSTGLPKPIVTNHATWAVADNDRNLPAVKGRENANHGLWNFPSSGGRYFVGFPPFHLGGFMALVVLPIFSTTATVVLGPADTPPTGRMVSQIMQRYHLRALFCPPIIFEQLAQEPEALKHASGLDFIGYAGGPLSSETGHLLGQLTNVCSLYGSTETGVAQTFVPLREDWAFLEWHPSLGADMQPSEDEAYEMVLHRDPSLEGVRSFSCNFPNVEEWHTKGLFRPHPNKPNLWKFHGRKDDIIVLSNGEKFNPVPSEAIISGHPLILGAVLVGQGRFQPALIVEPKEGSETQKSSLVEAIWPTVEQANAQAPGHARVTRSMITVTDTNKRFERAGKGTVMRKMTTEKFAAEVEALYSGINLGECGPRLAATNDMAAIQSYVRACVQFSFPIPSLEESEDLYVLGLDSLKSTEIATLLKGGLGTSYTPELAAQTIYNNPTIHKLSNVIFHGLKFHSSVLGESSDPKRSRIERMASLAAKFTRDLPTALPGRNPLLDKPKLNVLLTGSTGSLGLHLLPVLLDDPEISKIFCLNHSTNGKEIQQGRFASLGLNESINTPRVNFIQANYGQSHLGLADAQYHELTSTVDIIIHNAWKVDFNHSLESYEPINLQGVRNLIDWSLFSIRHPPIVFISSISSVGNWTTIHPEEAVPERPIYDHQMAQTMGYGESKHVAECILGTASERSGVPMSILRIGQIAGPVATPGIWNKSEWVYSLIKTSQSLGYFPRNIPDVDWIPVDTLASIILDITHCTAGAAGISTYNLVNPQRTPWTSLINPILQRLGSEIKSVDLSEWIRMLEQIDRTDTRQLTSKPAVKVLDFFRDLENEMKEGKRTTFSTEHGVSASKTMANLKPVGTEWMELWLRQWGY